MSSDLDDAGRLTRLLRETGDGMPVGRPDTAVLAGAVAQRRRRRRLASAGGAVAIAVAVVAAIAVTVNRPPKGNVVATAPTAPTAALPSATADQLASGTWSALPAAPILRRQGASVIWTGREVLVWGGAGGDPTHADGAAYDPSRGQWRPLPRSPLSTRVGQAAVWTGSEMVVWGGDREMSAKPVPLSDGAAYNPQTNSWRILPRSPLSPRSDTVAVWTGRDMLVLGGSHGAAADQNEKDGALYDPQSNRWTALAPPAPPGGHSLVWTAAVQGDGEVLAWSEWKTPSAGGVDIFAYNEATRLWNPIPATPATLPDVETVLWTGSLALVRGMPVNCGSCPRAFTPAVTDAFDPAHNTWTRLAPDPLGGLRLASTWTGQALFSYDTSFNSTSAAGEVKPGDASAYNPAAGTWRRLPSAPFDCNDQTPVWTGHQIVFYCPFAPVGRDSATDALAFTPAP